MSIETRISRWDQDKPFNEKTGVKTSRWTVPLSAPLSTYSLARCSEGPSILLLNLKRGNCGSTFCWKGPCSKTVEFDLRHLQYSCIDISSFWDLLFYCTWGPELAPLRGGPTASPLNSGKRACERPALGLSLQARLAAGQTKLLGPAAGVLYNLFWYCTDMHGCFDTGTKVVLCVGGSRANLCL